MPFRTLSQYMRANLAEAIPVRMVVLRVHLLVLGVLLVLVQYQSWVHGLVHLPNSHYPSTLYPSQSVGISSGINALQCVDTCPASPTSRGEEKSDCSDWHCLGFAISSHAVSFYVAPPSYIALLARDIWFYTERFSAFRARAPPLL